MMDSTQKLFYYEKQIIWYRILWALGSPSIALLLLIMLPLIIAFPLLLILLLIANLWTQRVSQLPTHYQCALSNTEFYQWHPYRRSLRVRMPVQELRRLYSMRDRSRQICKLQCVTARGQTIIIPVKPPFPLEDFLNSLRQANPAAEIDAHV